MRQHTTQPKSPNRPNARRVPRANRYLIEFRFHGYAKGVLRDLREAIAKNFAIKSTKQKMVPHITIVGPCTTRDEQRLIKEVERIVSEYDRVGFWLDGFGSFPGRAVYANICPSYELAQMRWRLVQSLKEFCQLQDHDHECKFRAHATLCLNTDLKSEQKFDKILEYLNTWTIAEMKSYVLRVTILGSNRRILCEYDLMLKRMLSRTEALDRRMFRDTVRAFKDGVGANAAAKKILRAVRQVLRVDAPGQLPPHHTRRRRLTPQCVSGKTFVVSDLHFDHANIIRYCNRPFGSVNEMNRAMIRNWNGVVDKDSTVYYLGDMAYGRGNRTIDYWLSRLNGKVRFIRGNHDTDIITRAEVIQDQFPVSCRGNEFLLMHDPYRPIDWDGWIIHGDKHNNNLKQFPHIHIRNKTVNVCAELTGYAPISLDDIISKISSV